MPQRKREEHRAQHRRHMHALWFCRKLIFCFAILGLSQFLGLQTTQVIGFRRRREGGVLTNNRRMKVANMYVHVYDVKAQDKR
jgi:hypothetical protein